MKPNQLLEQIFGVAFTEQPNLTALRQFHHKNAYCCNEDGEVIGIWASEHATQNLVILSKQLQKLQYLNLSENQSLQSLTFDGALPKLVHFDASDCNIRHLTFPKGFIALKDVYLQGNDLGELIFKGNFPQLRLLDIANNKNLKKVPDKLVQFSKLEIVFVKGSPILLGEENLSETDGNAWQKIRSYLAEFVKGSKLNYRAKMVIVGNGRVGKTSMAKRLKGEPFDKLEKYTHGINLGELTNEHFEETSYEDFSMKVWDFGGQDIFYATHQFFMTNTAIYVLAWTNFKNVVEYKNKMETEGEAVDFGEKWRAEQNWLENIRAYAKSAPILMVQTHCDKIQNRQIPSSEFSKAPYEVELCNFSAEKDIGLKELKLLLASKLDQLPYFGQEYPTTYDNVIEAIDLEKNTHPFISKTRYYIICDDAGIDEGNRSELLNYLRETGIIVHYPANEQLKDKIFIDPAWLTSSVYALLNKKLKEVQGKMDDAYIEARLVELYKNKGIEISKKDLIELLKSFKLIFETEEQIKGVASKIFIYPEYLPEALNRDLSKLYKPIKDTFQRAYTLKYTNYLPENVLINIISHYGPDTTDDLVWRNGIYFTIEKGDKGIIEFDPKTKHFTVYTQSSISNYLLRREICELFHELGKNTAMEVAITPEVGFVSWEKLTNPALISEFNCAKNPEEFPIVNDKGKVFCFADFAPLVIEHYHPKVEIEIAKSPDEKPNLIAKPNVYFSYAWKDEDNPDREVLVDDLYKELGSLFNIKRDKEDVPYGEYIDEFMIQLGKGKLIIVFISKKYLRSLYCMYELFKIAEKNGWDKLEFKDAILPIVVEPIDFSDYALLDLMDYWADIRKTKENYKQELHKRGVGHEYFKEVDELIELSNKANKLIFWIKNLNRGSIHLYRNDDFRTIKQTIKDRFEKSSISADILNEQFFKAIEKLGADISNTKTLLIQKFSKEFGQLSIKMDATLNGIEDIKSFHQDQQDILQQLTKQIQLNPSSQQLEEVHRKIEAQFQSAQEKLPQHIITLWQAANTKSAMEADVKGKLKLKFDLLPFLVYEKEISVDVKKVFKDIIQDIKNGHYFTKPA